MQVHLLSPIMTACCYKSKGRDTDWNLYISVMSRPDFQGHVFIISSSIVSISSILGRNVSRALFLSIQMSSLFHCVPSYHCDCLPHPNGLHLRVSNHLLPPCVFNLRVSCLDQFGSLQCSCIPYRCGFVTVSWIFDADICLACFGAVLSVFLM